MLDLVRQTRSIDVSLNGAPAGLVGITAGCAVAIPFGAIIGGLLVILSVEFFDKVLHIDDPVGAISVHDVRGFNLKRKRA